MRYHVTNTNMLSFSITSKNCFVTDVQVKCNVHRYVFYISTINTYLYRISTGTLEVRSN